MTMLFLTGDISGGDWAKLEFGVTPWDDPAYYREISPITYADRIRTPLLIQHSERDLRTTVGQAEALFTVLRSKKRPVRLMRVPDETHELTRSGTPYRRAENLVQVRDWFRHYLVDGKRACRRCRRPAPASSAVQPARASRRSDGGAARPPTRARRSRPRRRGSAGSVPPALARFRGKWNRSCPSPGSPPPPAARTRIVPVIVGWGVQM